MFSISISFYCVFINKTLHGGRCHVDFRCDTCYTNPDSVAGGYCRWDVPALRLSHQMLQPFLSVDQDPTLSQCHACSCGLHNFSYSPTGAKEFGFGGKPLLMPCIMDVKWMHLRCSYMYICVLHFVQWSALVSQFDVKLWFGTLGGIRQLSPQSFLTWSEALQIPPKVSPGDTPCSRPSWRGVNEPML